MKKILLTEAQYDVLCKALGWVEAAGDYSEFTEALKPHERGTLWRTIDKVKSAANLR